LGIVAALAFAGVAAPPRMALARSGFGVAPELGGTGLGALGFWAVNRFLR